VQCLYFSAVIPVKTGISDLWAMQGVASDAEIPAPIVVEGRLFTGMTASYTADICGVRNFTSSPLLLGEPHDFPSISF
jgi:hypothetical protein